MKIINSLIEWKEIRRGLAEENASLGFIPTMGALHEGHLSLMKKSQVENDTSLVSIFVNPTQFNDPSDFEKYPKTLSQDIELLGQQKIDFVLLPKFDELYKDNYRFKVIETEVSKGLCGVSREGHFDGVLTVVMKLLNLAKAHRAYFGEKDFQQLFLIGEMTKAFFMDTEIIACPTLREADGLAMSSRNLRLTHEERKLAPELFKALSTSADRVEAVARLEAQGFKVDYVEEKWGRRFAAAHLGKVRLIDNVPL